MKVIRGIYINRVQLACLASCFGMLAGNAQNFMSPEDALKIALRNNFGILVASKTVETAKQNNTAGNAGMLPTININGTGSISAYNTDIRSSTTESKYNPLVSKNLSGNIQLNWTLYDGSKMFITKSKLNQLEQQGDIKYRVKVLQTTYDVLGAYYDWVRQKQQLKSLDEINGYATERLKIVNAALDAGTQTRSELLQAQLDLNINKENFIVQQSAITTARQTLKVLLGTTETLDEPFDTIENHYQPDIVVLKQKIMNSNAGILQLQKQINIDELEIKEFQSANLPNVSFKAGYYASVIDNSAGTTLNNRSYGPQMSATVSIAVFNAGETKRKTSVARLQEEATSLELENLKLQLQNELETISKNFLDQQQLLRIEQKNNQLSKENMQLSIERLKQGQTTSLEVHQAQEYLAQSNTRLINIRYNLKMAELRLKQMSSDL